MQITFYNRKIAYNSLIKRKQKTKREKGEIKMKIVYYSLSGNTKQMAEYIKEGIEAKGKVAELVSVDEVQVEEIANEEIIILGCSANGVEQLDEEYMEPYVAALEGKVKDKKVALFGSYGWGDGEWMRGWEETMSSFGANLIEAGLIVLEAPEDEEAIENCRAFGRRIAEA